MHAIPARALGAHGAEFTARAYMEFEEWQLKIALGTAATAMAIAACFMHRPLASTASRGCVLDTPAEVPTHAARTDASAGATSRLEDADGHRLPQTPADSRFFADKDAHGDLRINLRFVDNFLRWECGRHLLAMELFPNTKEITESMACLAAVTEKLRGTVDPTDPDCVCVVVGDGRTPRTAALLAMRTKWGPGLARAPAGSMVYVRRLYILHIATVYCRLSAPGVLFI